ncbi:MULTISPECIES: (d)CMP kinase [unclassified Oceanobacter]|uniref:(d)CMP kinase n=1 Tax=unclassified Oceanobacter TaxID=2620260 RepID=UPI0026E2551E|nr:MULTISPECIES: (d)CMP kinase [unclassified Oceanobacter]MDO6682985.1 (d)CMP kinase [Oceanobacter sp. 5_MG-2023]MDP2506997.1 (d)CMP kinase [Oceanobacter sp. 3_MG-2023]MDP2548109.1 (d)CMP kinase [Oceanobacter sp. 4_MG-2023]MDP2609518.1 (d)CMP kinase [Oceanobacter sp. 1_MG-2023]MDP2613021.1 (d)CMP kinase [Oceanobacter sp. 2_MG-2023]
MTDSRATSIPAAVPTTSAVIAIDGPSGAGKGTVCALLAEQLGWHLLDSGALYRITGLAASRKQIALDDEVAVAAVAAVLDVRFEPRSTGVQVILENENVTDTIRTEDVGSLASQVAALPAVRDALLQRQRDFCQAPGLIADGRDMGTVVFPLAEVKVFLTASAEERGRRRYEQLLDKGFDASLPALIEDIRARDERDSNRAVAPLKPADDAITIDSTELTIDQVCGHVADLVRKAGLV